MDGWIDGETWSDDGLYEEQGGLDTILNSRVSEMPCKSQGGESGVEGGKTRYCKKGRRYYHGGRAKKKAQE